MLKYFYLKIRPALIIVFISAFLIVAVAVIFGINQKINVVQAGDEHNTSGYAWSENIGWISFNSTTGGGANGCSGGSCIVCIWQYTEDECSPEEPPGSVICSSPTCSCGEVCYDSCDFVEEVGIWCCNKYVCQ